MGNRGQKRAEVPEELPADKRACSSLEFRPSLSPNSLVQTQMNSVNSVPEIHTGDMETSSSSSVIQTQMSSVNLAPETHTGDMETASSSSVIQTQMNSVNLAPETHTGDMETVSSSSVIQTQMNSVNLAPETHTGDMETVSSSSVIQTQMNSVNLAPETHTGDMETTSSSSVIQTQMNSVNSAPDAHTGDMETTSSSSVSSQSEEEPEKDSVDGSCDSEGQDDGGRNKHISLRDYQRSRSIGDQGKMKRIVASLSEEGDGSGQLAALTELCEVLSFCTEDSMSTLTSDSLSPVLVKLAKHESNPDIMLLAIRAITYMCDVFPRASGFLVRHDAVPALCQRLMAIEYLDVAEQCLQALDKISREQPLACLQSGAIMAALSFIDFFSTSIQRVALSTVVNICKKLPSECPSPFMEAVPRLCNLLQYEDRQLVENVATCLIKIADRVGQSPEMMEELCKHGVVHQVTHLIDLNSRTTLGQPIHTGLIGLLVKLASGSFTAVRTLFELNISSILKDILSSYELSHGMPSQHVAIGQCNQVHEVLKLLNELLPTLARGDQDVQLASDKESFIVNQPDLLQKFGMDILTKLIQVVDSGANLYVCYGCLSIINKLVYYSKPDMLLELLKNINISSFLAGVLTRKDHHVLILALEITEAVLQKLPDYFLNSFIKEGVFFAVDALITPDKCSQLMFPAFSGTQLSVDPSQKPTSKERAKCLCYASDTGHLTSKTGNCKLEKDSVQNIAKRIWTNYVSAESHNPQKGLTDILHKLKFFSAALIDLLNMSTNNNASVEQEQKIYRIMHQIVEMLSGSEPISTFELIESGIVKSLVAYLSNGLHMRENGEHHDVASQLYILEKRFEVFARQLLSFSDPIVEDLHLSVIIRKLQSALSSVENFPVILSHASNKKNSYSTVPYGRCTIYPCLRVRFVKGEGETTLSDYSEDIMTVDSLSSVDAIEGFLWPKVSSTNKTGCTKSSAKCNSQTQSPPPEASSFEGNIPHLPEFDSMSSALSEMQEDMVNLSHSEPEEAVNARQTTLEEKYEGDVHNGSVKQELRCSSEAVIGIKAQHPASSSNKADSQKLAIYLEGHQLDRSLTLYQTILQHEMKANYGMFNGEKLWTQVHTVTYKRTLDPKECHLQNGRQFVQDSSVSDKVETNWQFAPFLSRMFDSELASDLDKSGPTYSILFLLKSLESMNKFTSHLMSRERIHAFAEGRIENLNNLKILAPAVPQNEFVSSKLTEKLEQQMRDPLAVSIGGMPSWFNQIMASCPFLFSFEARCKYFRLAAFGPLRGLTRLSSHGNSNSSGDRQPIAGGLARKKFLVCRDRILDYAAKMMDLHARHKVVLEVEYEEEVGTGLGPTLEFYTLVSHEFQKPGLGMWREDHSSSTSLQNKDYGIVVSRFGLFPRPWSSTLSASNEILFSEAIKKFVLLGQVVAKALQDGRVLDVPFSKAFYKLILGQELSLYDIQSFDPELGRTLIEFKALVDRKFLLDSACGVNSIAGLDLCFRDTKIEDLYLDFTLPGYPDYVLTSGPDYNRVYMSNLEEYVSQIVNATIHAGILRQVEAFRSGFNQVFPIRHLQIFTEEELECLLCGERDSWDSNELLDHVKFDHGYTASSPPVLNLLEIIQELDYKERRAFLQFVTGAPRLPLGGLASLNPKLTIVRKHCSIYVDAELPSVMTCANYLKLPPYSSKENMKQKLLYAITEGQGSFHLS